MVDSLRLLLNQWTSGEVETSHKSSDFATLSATHDTHGTQDVSFMHRIWNPESIRFNSRFMSSATTDFQSTELHRTVYGTKQMNIIDDGPEHFSEQAINLIRATEDV